MFYGKNTYIHDFWEEHFECGFWGGDYEAPITSTTGLVISDGRIRNMENVVLLISKHPVMEFSFIIRWFKRWV